MWKDVEEEAAMDDLILEMERLFPSPASVVFAGFIQPEELQKWWGPEGFTTPSLTFTVRVGDAYRIQMQPPDGDAFYLTGEIRDVEPSTRLSYTFVWEDPDVDDVETLVALSFTEVDGSTQVELQQGPFKTEARRALHRDGWTDCFNRLERLLSAGAA